MIWSCGSGSGGCKLKHLDWASFILGGGTVLPMRLISYLIISSFWDVLSWWWGRYDHFWIVLENQASQIRTIGIKYSLVFLQSHCLDDYQTDFYLPWPRSDSWVAYFGQLSKSVVWRELYIMHKHTHTHYVHISKKHIFWMFMFHAWHAPHDRLILRDHPLTDPFTWGSSVRSLCCYRSHSHSRPFVTVEESQWHSQRNRCISPPVSTLSIHSVGWDVHAALLYISGDRRLCCFNIETLVCMAWGKSTDMCCLMMSFSLCVFVVSNTVIIVSVGNIMGFGLSPATIRHALTALFKCTPVSFPLAKGRECDFIVVGKWMAGLFSVINDLSVSTSIFNETRSSFICKEGFHPLHATGKLN